jgi:competence protein ComGC
LAKENQILAYELEQAKMRYSIQKLVSETQKLSTNAVSVSEAKTETEDNVEVDV